MTCAPRLTRALKGSFSLGFVLAAALRAVTASAASPCPENRIVLTTGDVSVSQTSADSALDVSGSYGHGSYDLKSGALASSVSFYDQGQLNQRWAGCFVDTEDDHWILGPAAGTPVDFSAVLTVTGSWNVYPGVPQGEFSSEEFVSVETDTAQYSIPLPGGCCHASISQVLTLPLHRLSQQLFRLRLHLASQDYRGQVSEAGQLQFIGLPPGASVVNCHTAAEPPTPTRRSTWGEVKAHYR